MKVWFRWSSFKKQVHDYQVPAVNFPGCFWLFFPGKDYKDANDSANPWRRKTHGTHGEQNAGWFFATHLKIGAFKPTKFRGDFFLNVPTLRLLGMSWGVKTTCLEAPGLSLGGSGVSIGGVGSLRVDYDTISFVRTSS